MSSTGELDLPGQAQASDSTVNEVQLRQQAASGACTSTAAAQNATEPRTTEDCGSQTTAGLCYFCIRYMVRN
ncbi:hypothetical protein JG688_00001423 [Phytophthora aleatoria]|uniref:Uncharacterized protein n=1 Tax=Phytophthora aleatoria TaxID=2496075 RepID=A0A8J5IVV6_9STRA|nr:hypothetical protein JG688_00001423 [Phytophthora aleatoria]